MVTLRVDAAGRLLLERPQAAAIECESIAPFMLEMLDCGGLVPYLRSRGRFTGQSLPR